MKMNEMKKTNKNELINERKKTFMKMYEKINEMKHLFTFDLTKRTIL
jgi:hypothetical protein